MARRLWCLADADGLSDEHVLGRLPAEAAAEFEAHAMACADCASLIDKTRTLLRGMRLAPPISSWIVRVPFRAGSRWLAIPLPIAPLVHVKAKQGSLIRR